MRGGGGQLLFGDDARQAGGLGNVEEDVEGAFDGGDDEELQDGQLADGKGKGYAGHAERAACIAEDHDTFAVPTVDQCARGEAEDEVGEGAQGTGKAGLGGRTSESEDQEGEGKL